MVKNACGKSARKYLKEIKSDLRTTVTYVFSFSPKWIIYILRFFYKRYRVLQLKLFGPGEFKEVERWLKRVIFNK